MKLREFNFNDISYYIGLSVKGPDGKWYESCDGIGATLELLPIEFADCEIKETRTFFGSYVIELKEYNAADGSCVL